MSRLATITVGLVLVSLAATGCGVSSDKPPKLVKEYTKAKEVKNDRLRPGGQPPPGAPAEPSAEVLLTPVACDAYYNGPPDPDCDPGRATKAVEDAMGSKGELYGRSILVKRASGSLEVLPLFVVVKGDGPDVFFDASGQKYRDLKDFRENNELLAADDWMLTAKDPVDLSEEVEYETVPGHTPGTWGWWAGGIGAVLLVAVGLLWFTWIPRSDRGSRGPDNADSGMRATL
ncbi:MAG: hypothetical protein ACRD0P_07395 [Stackebrandtia sp.]